MICSSKLGKKIYRKLACWTGFYTDRKYLDSNVPLAQLVSHRNYLKYLIDFGNHTGKNILEIGSREVTATSHIRTWFSNATYVGFDYYPGANVDIVGDAHRLSDYFTMQQFDLIYSTAVFEHFAMPWIVAIEISKLLKIGGIVFIETHFTFGSHERPWHFFQFSDMALRVLFSPALGFECLEAGASNPMVGRFSAFADSHLRGNPIPGLYCHSQFLGRKVRNVDNFDWSKVNLDEVVGESKYPAPKCETE